MNVFMALQQVRFGINDILSEEYCIVTLLNSGHLGIDLVL